MDLSVREFSPLILNVITGVFVLLSLFLIYFLFDPLVLGLIFLFCIV